MTLETIAPLFETFGLSAGLLLLMVFGVFRIIKWMAPRVERMFTAHISLVDDLRVQVNQQTELSRETLTAVQETNRLLQDDDSL